MSADNFYVIRRHPKGGYAAVMGFASDEGAPLDAHKDDKQFDTPGEAEDWAMQQYSEYGVTPWRDMILSEVQRGHLVSALNAITNVLMADNRHDEDYSYDADISFAMFQLDQVHVACNCVPNAHGIFNVVDYGAAYTELGRHDDCTAAHNCGEHPEWQSLEPQGPGVKRKKKPIDPDDTWSQTYT